MGGPSGNGEEKGWELAILCAFPLPRIEETLTTLKRAKFSALWTWQVAIGRWVCTPKIILKLLLPHPLGYMNFSICPLGYVMVQLPFRG